jgi:hypothetical protein
MTGDHEDARTPGRAARDQTSRAARSRVVACFLSESQRLRAAANHPDTPTRHAKVLRHQAVAWRTTAGRILAIPQSKWPWWLLDHLDRCAELPVLGVEYARQRAVLLSCLAEIDP